jgi:hypothetical protein
MIANPAPLPAGIDAKRSTSISLRYPFLHDYLIGYYVPGCFGWFGTAKTPAPSVILCPSPSAHQERRALDRSSGNSLRWVAINQAADKHVLGVARVDSSRACAILIEPNLERAALR